jgi:AraC family transcriptional regulator
MASREAGLEGGNGTDANAELMRREARHRLKALLLSIHTLVADWADRSRGAGQLAWDRMSAWIDGNLNRPISTIELAALVRVSPGTLARKFRQHYRVTISHYVLHKRIDKAKSLLATTTLPVHEVGSLVGIVDPQYFNKQFRKVAGTSPSQYREENGSHRLNKIQGRERAFRSGSPRKQKRAR